MTAAPIRLLALVLPLAGCATDPTSYPSLSPRAVEKLGFAEPVAPTRPAAAPDPALDASIAEAVKSLTTIERAFADAATVAAREARAARGAAAGSERWIEAQTALATLDDLRAQTSSVVTDLDQLAVTRGAALTADYPALEAVKARATFILDDQTSRIASLSASLAPA